ncbi:MAG: D-glycerate dehydrogenase [Burkholderiaceae bacterium]
MKPRLLITRQVFDPTIALLREAFDVEDNQSDALWDADELKRRVADKQALFVTASDAIGADVIDAAPDLRIISTGSVGYNQIDVARCRERGIVVTNTPDVLTEATADMAWALLMAAARRVGESERWLRDGQWQRWAFDQFLGQDVHGSRLGIVGMGRIGSAVARRARGFSMTVGYFNRSVAPNEAELGATRVDLPTLLRESDHVVIVVPYSAQTHHLIGAAELASMKPTAVLVNIARGGIVDDRALAQALCDGRLGAAGLDVYENEPAVEPALLSAPRVVLTPHLGSATRSTRVAMAELAARNLCAWARSQPLLTPVNAG